MSKAKAPAAKIDTTSIANITDADRAALIASDVPDAPKSDEPDEPEVLPKADEVVDDHFEDEYKEPTTLEELLAEIPEGRGAAERLIIQGIIDNRDRLAKIEGQIKHMI